MSSSGGHYGGNWGQGDDPWGQGGQPAPDPAQGNQQQQPWVQPTHEWGGQSQEPPAPGSWDAGPPSSQNWDAGPPPQGGGAQQGWGGQQQQPPPPGGFPPPGGQPQWGAPPPPGGGYGPPPGKPPGKSNKGLIIGLSAGGGVFVLIIIIVIIVVATSGGGGSPTGGPSGSENVETQRKQSWTVPEPDSEKSATTLSAFPTKDNSTLVRISQAGITGYNAQDGKEKWTIAVPEGTTLCAASREAPDDVAAMVFGADEKCTTVAAVDVVQGKQLWSNNFKVNDANFAPRNAAVSAAAGKIYISTGERVIRYDAKLPPASSGEALPLSAAPKEEGCSTGDVRATDKGALATLTCGYGEKSYLIALTPSDKGLSSVWTTEVKSESRLSTFGIVSATPPIVHVDNASDHGELRLFDDKGVQTKVIQSRGDGGAMALRPSFGTTGFNDMRDDYPVQIVGTTLIAMKDKGSDYKAKPAVIAVNLTTGEREWTKEIDTPGDGVMVRTADAAKVTVLTTGGYDDDYTTKHPPQLVTIDPAKKGASSPGDKIDIGDESSSSTSFSYSGLYSMGKYLLMLKLNKSGDGAMLTGYGPK